MGVLISEKLEQAIKFIHSQTADDLQAWIDMDNARMALVDQEEDDDTVYLQEYDHRRLRVGSR